MTENNKKILFIKPSAMGDIVMALPALKLLREKYPNAHIDWLVRKEFAPLLESHPLIDGLIIFDRKKIGSFWKSKESLKELLAFIRKLREGNYDLTIDLQGLFRTGLFSLITGSKQRIGMEMAREGATLFYNTKIAKPSFSDHIVDYYLKLISHKDVKIDDVQFPLNISGEDRAWVSEKLEALGVNLDNYVVLIPSASNEKKCWAAENFAAVCEKIHDKFNLDIVAVGTGNEREIVDNIQKNVRFKIANLAGETTLPQLCALLSKARLAISNDTGPGHISYAAGTPTVFIFGQTNPKRLEPYRHSDYTVCVDYEGRGSEIESENTAYAIDNVSIESVLQKAQELLVQ